MWHPTTLASNSFPLTGDLLYHIWLAKDVAIIGNGYAGIRNLARTSQYTNPKLTSHALEVPVALKHPISS